MTKILPAILLLGAITLLAACDDKNTAEQAAPPPTQEENAQIIESRLDEWLGDWHGPDNETLTLGRSGEGYSITIKNEAGEERYLGVVVTGQMRLRFLRGDAQEYLRFGPGRDSGIQALGNKRSCLIVKDGEAYCREKM